MSRKPSKRKKVLIGLSKEDRELTSGGSNSEMKPLGVIRGLLVDRRGSKSEMERLKNGGMGLQEMWTHVSEFICK